MLVCLNRWKLAGLGCHQTFAPWGPVRGFCFESERISVLKVWMQSNGATTCRRNVHWCFQTLFSLSCHWFGPAQTHSRCDLGVLLHHVLSSGDCICPTVTTIVQMWPAVPSPTGSQCVALSAIEAYASRLVFIVIMLGPTFSLNAVIVVNTALWL